MKVLESANRFLGKFVPLQSAMSTNKVRHKRTLWQIILLRLYFVHQFVHHSQARKCLSMSRRVSIGNYRAEI